MDLKKRIEETLRNRLNLSFLSTEETDRFFQETTDAIWDAIGDSLGVTQEKLMTQLNAARTELQVERNRVQALYTEVASLQAQLLTLTSDPSDSP